MPALEEIVMTQMNANHMGVKMYPIPRITTKMMTLTLIAITKVMIRVTMVILTRIQTDLGDEAQDY